MRSRYWYLTVLYRSCFAQHPPKQIILQTVLIGICVVELNALEQAGIRLARAQVALTDLKAADNFRDAERAWTDFLLAANTFFAKLEQGAKSNGRSNAWFGRKVKQRKDDPVLRYLKAARNSDEHGIERVTERADAGWEHALSEPLKFGQQFKTSVRKVDEKTGEPFGPATEVFLYGRYLRAITAHDRRFHVACEPPAGLLDGRDGAFPPDIAEVAIESLQTILEEAAGLVI